VIALNPLPLNVRRGPTVIPPQPLDAAVHGAYNGYMPALEGACAVGRRVVAEWMKVSATSARGF
jgi:hypothetical protein